MRFKMPGKKARLILAGIIIIPISLAFIFWVWLQPKSPAPETLFYGGTIITMDPSQPTPEALLMRGERIVAAGPLSQLRQQTRPGVEEYNLQGRTLMPGLIEPHSHPLATALLNAAIDVSGFTHSTREEAVLALMNGIEKTPEDRWAIAFGWDPIMLNDMYPPTLEELDSWSQDKPLIILTQMMHEAYANSAALRAANINSDTPNPPGGEFVKDKAGALTGTVLEVSALNRLLQAAPPPPKGAADLLLYLQYGKYAQAGYTTVATMGPVGKSPDPLMTLRTAAINAPVRTLTYALPSQLKTASLPEKPDTNAAVIGVKFWMDGSPFAGGAAFRDGYENSALTQKQMHLSPGHIASLNHSQDDFEKQFKAYHTKGYQIAVHAQGELAIERVLNVIEKVLAEHPRKDHRHRLEHNALITQEQLTRATELGVTTSFFVDHLYYYGHILPDLIGQDRLNRYMPIKSALMAGHKATVHTDNPATPINALRAMQTLRARASRTTQTRLSPHERLTPYEALQAMTINAAWQLGIEGETGSLTPGKRADLLLLSGNPLITADKELQGLKVETTWVAGQPTDTRELTSRTIELGFTMLSHFWARD